MLKVQEDKSFLKTIIEKYYNSFYQSSQHFYSYLAQKLPMKLCLKALSLPSDELFGNKIYRKNHLVQIKRIRFGADTQ